MQPQQMFSLSRLLPSALAAFLALAAASCGKQEAGAKAADSVHPGTAAGAQELIAAFQKPGADLPGLSQSLRPTKADYTAVFSADFATRLMDLYDPAWEKRAMVLTPKEGQTDLILNGVPSDEIRVWSKAASDHLPGGYEKIKDEWKSGFTVYAFKFVKPGESMGMAYDGLVHVNNHWCIFPKPYRAAP